jgi:hypothetical protein
MKCQLREMYKGRRSQCEILVKPMGIAFVQSRMRQPKKRELQWPVPSIGP